ncbi:MAG: hypothetical protein KC516_03140 [Nanoarchaeota archaeon]|nr:hypothetical protein [Nanoarchaeota archaeon]
MENKNLENLSEDEVINLGIELLKDSKVNVGEVINYLKNESNLEKFYNRLGENYSSKKS